MITEELYRELKKITGEEERILNGSREIDKELYMSAADGETSNVIDAGKLLETGKLGMPLPIVTVPLFP